MLQILLCVTVMINYSHAVFESPLCQYCECEKKVFNQWDENDVIICRYKLHYDIFNETYWRNTTTIYKIWSVTIQHNFVGNLTREFPTSPLIELNLSENEITNINVDIFRNITFLQTLILSNNDFEMFLENDESLLNIDIFNETFWKDNGTACFYWSLIVQDNFIGNLSSQFPSTNLKELNLENNALDSIVVDVCKNLICLEVLILSRNDINVFAMGSQESVSLPLQYLEDLRLDHNKICSLNSDIFQNVLSLKILDLSYNPLKTIEEQTFKAVTGLKNLKELYLQNTQITTLPDGLLHSLKKLEVLDLSINPLTVIPQSLRDCQSLTQLNMNNTGLIRLSGQNIFPNIPTIKSLHLSHNEDLVEIGMFSFGGLTELQNLSLSNNIALSKIDAYAFAAMTDDRRGYAWLKIERLYLQYNNLSYINPNITDDWKHFTDLDIGGNSWICDCKNQWLIDDLYPTYEKINKENAISTRCSAPEEMKNVKFQDLLNNKTRLKCVDEKHDTIVKILKSSITVPAVVGFFSGFFLAISIVVIIVLGNQRNWFSGIRGCNYRRFRSSPSSRELFGNQDTFEI